MTIFIFRRDPPIKVAQDIHKDRFPIYALLWSRGKGNDFVTPDMSIKC